MGEEQRARIDEAMTKMVEDVEKSYIRSLQSKMFKCAAGCCDDKESSTLNVQRCIKSCAVPLESAQNIIRDEINHLQDRLQRCIMSCNDAIRDKMGAETSEINRYTGEFESCAKKCVDSHINLIPDVSRKIKELMKKERF